MKSILKTEKFLFKKLLFIIIFALNAATGSKYDANSNVTEKNITTLTGELPKGKNDSIK